MNQKFPLKEAMETGAWLECHARLSEYSDEEITYRLRIISFRHFSFDEVDTFGEEIVIEDDGVLWLLIIDIVNLCKKKVDSWHVRDSIILIDEDGFEFESLYDGYLHDITDESAKEIGLHRFSGSPLPKIRATGSIAFLLPDEEIEYCIAIKEVIQED